MSWARARHCPAFCAGGHRCGLGEHRAEPVRIDVPGAGVAVLTRVLGADGRQYAEITMRVALPEVEAQARYRLAALVLVSHLRVLIGPARQARGVA